MNDSRRMLRRLCLLPALLIPHHKALSQTATSIASDGCKDLPHADHPRATIGNGSISAVVFLPDQERGYYRGARFDWAGLIGCASLHGHTFFGEWFKQYDPNISDAVTGPAEEFRHPTSELGYDEAAPGGSFLKIGVGVLQRIDARPYRFGGSYPVLDHGTWTVKTGKRSITFRQQLQSKIGYAYVYEKTLSLDGDTITMTHSLHNTGEKPLDTAVYSHDFFMLDQQPTGPGMELRLPFVPVPDTPLPDSAKIEGKTIRIVAPVEASHGIGAYVTGFSDQTSDFDFTFEDTTRGIGVQETGSAPLVRMYLWATPKTFCPEGYLGIHVAPGQTQTWIMRYRLFTN